MVYGKVFPETLIIKIHHLLLPLKRYTPEIHSTTFSPYRIEVNFLKGRKNFLLLVLYGVLKFYKIGQLF